jgi:rhodanese-related sulfurtransferase
MNFNLSQIIVILLVFILIIFLYCYAMNSPYRVSSEEAKEIIKKGALVLDVRTDFERSTLGYYPNSVHIPSSDLEERMPSEYPNKNINIVAYCNSGQRARIATEKLHSLGYTNSVYIVSTYGTLL